MIVEEPEYALGTIPFKEPGKDLISGQVFIHQHIQQHIVIETEPSAMLLRGKGMPLFQE